MAHDMDWQALMASEVFTNYANDQLIKEANADKEEYLAMVRFDEFENTVRSDKKLCLAFRAIQKKIATEPGYRESLDSNFADGVMLLDLE